MSERATYISGTRGSSELISRVNSLSPGVYHSSEAIRNEILSRNLGKYALYKESISATGGESIGEAYSIGKEVRPTSLGEGGIYGYTHDSKLGDNDPILRNENILSAFYDYEASDYAVAKLNEINHGLPWNDQLYGRSDVSTQENSKKFIDYRDYMKSMFQWGLSFENSLDNRINSLMFNGYTKNKTLVNDVTHFIDSHQGTIINPVPTDWSIGDTKLGYIGKHMVANQRYLRSSSLADPITEGINYEGLENKILKNGTSNLLLTGEAIDRIISDMVQVEGNFITDELENGRYALDGQNNDVESPSIEPNLFSSLRDINLIRNVKYQPWKPYAKFSYGEIFENGRGEIKNSTSFRFNDGGVFESEKPDRNYKTHGEQAYQFYDERDEKNVGNSDFNRETIYGQYRRFPIEVGLGENDLLTKTRQLFRDHKIKTLISRFHTSSDDGIQEGIEETQTAVTQFGLSHGRNLLKKSVTTDNGYENPYCRVWTYHHQYARMNNLIRPFNDDNGNTLSLEGLQSNYPFRPILDPGRGGGWSQKSVLNRNGMVNISPMRDAYDNNKVKIKQCMFSIENLAWKDMQKKTRDFPESEVGPLGGRIMWFPPYDLSISENESVQWQSNDFIGRGERIYTYANTERTGTLSFTIIADHPSVINQWFREKEIDNITSEDMKDGFQQDLLRFFAGCENLELESKKVEENPEPTSQKTDKKNNVDGTPAINNDVDEETGDNYFSFYVFYPNNLSGADWKGDAESAKKLADYLMFGKHKKEYIEIGKKIVDTNIENTTTANIGTSNVLGYEIVKANEGITEPNLESTIVENNNKYQSNFNNNPDNSKFVWGYGIDKSRRGEKLKGGCKGENCKTFPPNYIDSLSCGLNTNRGSLIKDDPEVNCSFADIYIALQLRNGDYNGVKSYLTNAIASTNEGVTDAQELIDEIYDKLFNLQKIGDTGSTNVNNERRKIFFSVNGGATNHGEDTGKKNNELAKNRALFPQAWLRFIGGEDWTYVEDGVDNKINDTDDYNVSDEKAKLGRNAKVKIWWETERVTQATPSTGETESVEGGEIAPATVTASRNIQEVKNNSYGDEYNFFKELQKEDSLLYKNIVDKIKYFDPAFHSITPEGFNGRLAFLHQCTRQGNTMQANSDKTGGYAGNLAFGRPPVCVLRLGDFYNTRIIINSINLQFENNQWDLNPEGIGVQPMFVKVNINFVFQGGSSLGGPVTRLQNAISFNYYANQEVYDGRADVMEYKDDGSGDIKASMIWVPGVGAQKSGVLGFTGQEQEEDEKLGTKENDNGVQEEKLKDASDKIGESQMLPEEEEDKMETLILLIATERKCLTKEDLLEISSDMTFGEFAKYYEKEPLSQTSLVEALLNNCSEMDWLKDIDFGGCIDYNNENDLIYLVNEREINDEFLGDISLFRSKEKLENYMRVYLNNKVISTSFFNRASLTDLNTYIERVTENAYISMPNTCAMLLYSLTYGFTGVLSDDVRKRHLEKLGTVFYSNNTVTFDKEKMIGRDEKNIFDIMFKKFGQTKEYVIRKLTDYDFV